MSVKLLSEKVSYSRKGDRLQILILGKIDRWKESLILGWILAWVFCGGIVISEYIKSTDRDFKIVMFVFLIFWVYYLWRIVRVFLYRRGGNELIMIEDGVMWLKKSFFTYGKSHTYNLNQITDFKPIELKKTSVSYHYENGWWVLGGEKLAFIYNGRYVKFAMQIDDHSRDTIFKLIQKEIAKASKN